MGRRLTLFVCLLVAVAGAQAQAQTCRGAAPRVNKPGFRPRQAVAFSVASSPESRPFPADKLACVWRAFHAWTAANASTTLGVRFVHGPDGIVVRFADVENPLPPYVAGGWTDGEREDDGALRRANIWLSSDERLLDSCDGVTKVVLHELGHLHGLADESLHPGSSVMNSIAAKNDRGNRIPLAPTACDAAQAVVAAAAVDAPLLGIIAAETNRSARH
jgi:hypothetical protein